MTLVPLVPLKQTLWILWVFLSAVAAEDSPCPQGGQVHLSSRRCFWLSVSPSSWSDAQASCRETQGGDVASAESPELQEFIHHSFSVKSTVWVWLKGSGGEGADQTGVMEPRIPEDSPGGCTQMALGTLGQWRKTQCAGRYLFLCEKEVAESFQSVDSYLTGSALMSGFYAKTQIQPLPSAPDIGQLTVEMQLFPGLWFSHAGQLVSVELVVQPSPESSLARVQILRPYCNPNHHLVPPGCSALLNPFSCCSAVPLCNTTGGCSRGQYWCHLLEACVSTTSPCSPYDSATGARGFALPPRYTAIQPFYHLVADLPLRINPSSDLKSFSLLLPDRAIMVYPDDIVAIQHTRDSGTFLHCLNSDASLNSPWRQSYMSLRRRAEWGGWWEGGLTSLPQRAQWVDGVVCDLRMLYVDNLHRGTEHDGFTERETTTVLDNWALTTGPTPHLGSKFDLNIIHPVPDEKNQIHVQINVPTLIVVKVQFGEKARSSWSAPVLQTGVPFVASCPEEVAQSWDGCKRQSHDAWFSSVTLVLNSVGVQTLNIGVMDAESSQSVSVSVCSYEEVTGLSVEPHGCRRMLVDTQQSFIAKVESGSSVKFTWLIDYLENLAHEGDSYIVMFKKPAEYKLRVTASNPVSSQSQQILLTADEMTPLSDPEFLLVREVIAVDATHLYTLRVKVDISLPVTFRWDFGDGSSQVIHTQSASCQIMEGLKERGEKQVYVQDSVNYTYPIPDDYPLHVQVSNQYDSTDASTEIRVRPEFNRLLISSNLAVPLVNQTLILEASAEPPSFAVVYTWDFGDGSEALQSIQSKVNHSFDSAGVYNVSVCANNTLTALNTWIMVEVMEEISGLTVSYNGPSEQNSATDFRATVVTGTSLTWVFDFGDGSHEVNHSDGSISHVYALPGNYTVDVTVSNTVSQAHQSISVEVYRLAVSGVLPTACVMSGKDIQFTALVNGNISNLTFHWLFQDGSPLTVVRGHTTALHTFLNQGICQISLSVLSSVSSVSYNTSICVESLITNVTVQPSKEVGAVGEELCFKVLVLPDQINGYQFNWINSSSSLIAVTENAQKCFIFRDEGVEVVLVTASNRVSIKTARASITIQNPVRDLSVGHDGESTTLTVNASASFWVASCTGSNVSVLWDFGDGSPVEQDRNVSHVFASTGEFTVTATAFNAVSRDSVTLKVNVLNAISELSLHTNQPYAVVGEETLISAISSAISSTNYYWTVDGITSNKQGSYQFRFAFLKPGVYHVRVIAQNLVSRKEAAIIIEVFERIEGLRIECQNLINVKYVPTQEELVFIASITKGSDVTYEWLATQSAISRQFTGDEELLQMVAETPGGISVQLRASNKLGEAISVVSVVAVQRVTGAHITTRSNTVALGKAVNISVSVATGSDLEYLWYFSPGLSALQTHAAFLLHTFTSVRHCFVRVSVQNVLSRCNVTQEFNVQERIQEVDFKIEGKTHPFYATASSAVQLQGIIRKGSDLHWSWEVRGANVLNSFDQTFLYTFPYTGIYQVSLNVSNGINWEMVSHSVTVQDAVEGLTLNLSKSSFCTEEQVTLIPTISKGSNVSFALTFRNQDWTRSQSLVDGCFTTSSLPAGEHVVTVTGWNHVSSSEVSSSIHVTEHIQGLRLVNCCSDALEALKGIRFRAEVQSGLPVNYDWIFNSVGSEPTLLTGQDVIFTPAESGLLSVSVLASNGVCSKTINDTASVQWPVKKVRLVCRSGRIFVGHAVRFSAQVKGASNPRYLWDFGDSTETLRTDLNTVNHTYSNPGKYIVVVKVFNSISHVSRQLHIQVEELLCSSPQVSLIQSHSTVFRSRKSFFEASVDISCSAYKATYLWEVLKDSDCTGSSGNKVLLGSHIDATSPFLLLPKHTLDLGQYCLLFTVSLQGTPLLVQRNTSVTVVYSALVAVIKGGSHRLWPSDRDLILDGSESEDPDVEPGVEDTLQYHWTFMTVNSTESQFAKQPQKTNSSKRTILGTQLHPGSVYVFTLTVHKAGRSPASVNQTVTVSGAPVFPVVVDCVSCSLLSSPHQISYTNPIILSGQCGQCDDRAQYKWSAEDPTGVTLDLKEVSTSTSRHSPNLVVRSGVLQPGQSYTFTLNVSQPGRGRWGHASLTIQPNNPPHGGLCGLSPESDIRLLETVVTYNCSGWQGKESRTSQLIYTFQVAPCHPNGPVCPLLTLYRGTRSSYGSLVPMGSPGQERSTSVISVTLLVEDHLGAKVIALNRMLTVETPPKDAVASQWLRNKSQTELWALVQQGNPQEIIPYSIALTSQLNQLEAGQTAMTLGDRREIRENVTRALASLPVSSMLNVDQISSALSLSTAVPGELVCEKCLEKVLEAVGKMIHVMEEQMSPGVLSAVETGTNILNIIGSTLVAVSVRPFSSDPVYTTTLQSASTNVLLALNHAGALMRSLMQSRVHGQAPLSLSNDYINTVSFHGDPSELLCTQKSNQHPIVPSHRCPFHIPSSLTAHLQKQKSEVVQVLFDADLGSNLFLTAADPPISTALVAMELTTPQGQPIPIRDLDPNQAIRVTLPNKHPVGQEDGGGAGNGTCLTVMLPTEGRLNFTVKAVDRLDENAGLYISFNFSLDPGVTPVSLGHVRVDVSSAVPGTDASWDSLVREWDLTLSAAAPSTEETIFLSPLLNRTDQPLSVHLTSSLVAGVPVHVSMCVFSSVCQYYSVQQRRWSSEGLQPLEGSTLHAAHCLTQHLTMFGASLFLHPGAVVLLPPPGGPVRNLLVGMVCAVLVLIHLLVGLIAHKLDHLERSRLSRVPLCGQPGLHQYRVLVKTGRRRGAGTTAHVGISLYGVSKSGARHLQRDGAFQRGGLDQFHLETDDNLGEVWKIRIWHDNTGLDPSWFVQHVVVWDPQTDHMFFFLLEDWLSVENQKNGSVEKEVLASCPEELSQFHRVFSSQLMFGIVEHHLWLSLWERPAHSRFSRAQRVTCSAVMLHLYLALGALWYGAVSTEGHSGPVSARLPVNMEAVAVGMTVAALVFPLQCLLSFLFRRSHSQVTVDLSVPPSPVCHSVEMDVFLGQSDLSGPSFLSLSHSSGPLGDSPSSLLDSKALDSSILDFWAASGLAPQKDGVDQEGGVGTWPSCDSLLNLPACFTETPPTPILCKASPPLGSSRQLRRKKNLQLRLDPPASTDSRMKSNLVQVHSQTLATVLTLSEEDLLMSIAAAADTNHSNSDSGRDSPRTISSPSPTSSRSCSSWSEVSESLLAAQTLRTAGLYRSPSVLSVDSVASTFLPSPSPDSTHSPSTTRIGVARGRPGLLLPPWALRVIYPLLVFLLVACLAVIGLYGSFFSRSVVLMWLLSTLSALLASALLLEPLKVCVQALICTLVWRPVDPEVEDQLALQSSVVVRGFGDHGGRVRPPCGYSLLQAKEEARRVRALRSLMRRCVCQLLFLLLVLMVNYQAGVEQREGRLLGSSVRRELHSAPGGVQNLTSLRDWSNVEQWIHHTLVPHLHKNPTLQHVGSARLQHTHTLRPHSHTLHPLEIVYLGNSSAATRQLLTDLHVSDWTSEQFKTLSLDFTHFHRESGLFVCVSVKLECVQSQRVSSVLSIHPLLIPSSDSGPDLQAALMVLLLISALLLLVGELWSVFTERSQYLRRCGHWFQLLLASLSLATSILQLCFLSQASNCVSELRSNPESFIDFLSAAQLSERSSQCAAVLLTMLVLKLLGTLRFVRRWGVLVQVLQGAWRELWATSVLLLLLLLLCTHLGSTLFSRSVEGFLSLRQSGVSVLSMLRGRAALRTLCRIHPVLGPLYGLMLLGGGVWILARLCGAVLILAYRAERAQLYRPTFEPQDYEMVEFFIKRLKLWMGLSKAKEFRHSVKFEGMDGPPSRSSQESRLSNFTSSPSSSFSSPRPPSSSLSVRSEDSTASDVQPYLDRLLPCVTALLSRFDQVNQVMEDVHNLEIKLEEAQARRRRISEEGKRAEKPKEVKGDGKEAVREVRHRKIGLLHPKVSLPSSFYAASSSCRLPRARSTFSESESAPYQPHASCNNPTGLCGLHPAASPGNGPLPRRRAWHSGSSHSADAAQRILQTQEGVGGDYLAFTDRPRSEEGVRRQASEGVPVKRKAWTEQD